MFQARDRRGKKFERRNWTPEKGIPGKILWRAKQFTGSNSWKREGFGTAHAKVGLQSSL